MNTDIYRLASVRIVTISNGMRPRFFSCSAKLHGSVQLTSTARYFTPQSWATVLVNDDAAFAGALQRLHRAQAECTGVPGAHLLPASEAHGGRQDPLSCARSCPDPQPTAHGGQITVWFFSTVAAEEPHRKAKKYVFFVVVFSQSNGL